MFNNYEALNQLESELMKNGVKAYTAKQLQEIYQEVTESDMKLKGKNKTEKHENLLNWIYQRKYTIGLEHKYATGKAL